MSIVAALHHVTRYRYDRPVARLFRTLKDPSYYGEIQDDLELLTGIVDDLNLNTRIWTKT